MNKLSELKQYILEELGSPIIQVELTDKQIENAINDAIQKFTEYSYGDLEGVVVLNINGKGEYQLPKGITNILMCSKGSVSNITNFSANYGDGYVPNIWSEQFFTGSLTGNIIDSVISISSTKAVLDKFFGHDLNYNFNPHKAILQVFEGYTGPAVVHYQYEYVPNTEDDKIYNHEWIKLYAKALCKIKWGNNIGKYDQALVGGARINYDRILSEGQADLDFANEQLLTKWAEVAPILIG